VLLSNFIIFAILDYFIHCFYHLVYLVQLHNATGKRRAKENTCL